MSHHSRSSSNRRSRNNRLRIAAGLVAIGAIASVGGVAGTLSTHNAKPRVSKQSLPVTAHTPRRADDLVNSFGVVTHFDRETAPYNNTAGLDSYIRQLHVRHFRGRLYPNDTALHAAWNHYKDMGIRFNAVTGGLNDTPATMSTILGAASTKVPGAVESFEMPNETNLARDPQWAGKIATYTRAWVGAQAAAATNVRSIPTVAPSIGNPRGAGHRCDYAEMMQEMRAQGGSYATSMDFGNLHNYPGGQEPSVRIPEGVDGLTANANDTCANGEPTLPGSRDVMNNAKQILVTESGYHDDESAGPDVHLYTPEDVQGVYEPKHIMEYFQRPDVKRMYLYELADEPSVGGGDKTYERHFGLVKVNTDGSMRAKASLTSIGNLMALADDGNPGSYPLRPFSYGIRSEVDVRSQLLQRRDGSYLLVLWRRDPIYVPSTRARLTVDPSPVTVTFATGVRKTVSLFKPNLSASSRRTATAANTLTFNLGQNIAVLKIT